MVKNSFPMLEDDASILQREIFLSLLEESILASSNTPLSPMQLSLRLSSMKLLLLVRISLKH